jgi:hypothetical protein
MKLTTPITVLILLLCASCSRTGSDGTNSPHPEVLCVELSKDGSSAFVSRGPCSRQSENEGGGGGGSLGGKVAQCRTKLEADTRACDDIKDPQAKAKCHGTAQGTFVGCLLDSVQSPAP